MVDWEEECNKLIIQLAACSTVAMGYVDNPANVGDYDWSPAYQDVLNLRLEYDRIKKELKEVAPFLAAHNACGYSFVDEKKE